MAIVYVAVGAAIVLGAALLVAEVVQVARWWAGK